jgi:anti-sigma28 factor (negative regulator of flagellin synthesis)
VADIRARIAAGTYRIDAEAIAAKMIRDAFSDDP